MLHTAGGDFFTFPVYSLRFCNQNQRVSKGKNWKIWKYKKICLRRCDRSRFFSCFRFAAGLSGNVCRTQTAVRAPLARHKGLAWSKDSQHQEKIEKNHEISNLSFWIDFLFFTSSKKCCRRICDVSEIWCWFSSSTRPILTPNRPSFLHSPQFPL